MREILGRPIEGEYSRYNERGQVEQYDEHTFLALLDAVFAADPEVTALGWRQYTPYFNDGDACYFGIHSENILAKGAVPLDMGWEFFHFEEGTDDDDYYEYDDSPADYQGPGKTIGLYALDRDDVDGDLYQAANAFYTALDRGNFDNVILTAFGDPATVIATREGFKIEFCDHE